MFPMENNKTLIFWIVLDLLLLIGVIFVCSYWFNITSDLKSPCYNCAKERPEIEPCLSEPIYVSPYEIDLSEIIKEENIKIKNKT